MKLLPILVFLSLAATVRADDSAASCQIGWPEGYFAQDKVPPKMEAYEEGLDMSFVYWGEKPADLKLQEIDEDFLSRLTASPFAILGRYQCSKIAPGSTLEMLCHFTPEKPGDPELVYTSKTPIVAETGPSDRWQTFLLPFDATGAKTHLVKIELKLHLVGGYGSSMGFDQVYLRQYPDGKFPNTASSSGTAHLQGDTLAATLPSPIPSLQPAFQVVVPAPPPIASDAPALQVIADLPFEKYPASEQDQKDLLDNFHNGTTPSDRLIWKQEDEAHITFPKEPDGTIGLLLVRSGPGTDRTAILTVPQELVRQITGTRYGIMGEVSYSGVNHGALSMVSCFSRAEPSAPMDIWYGDMEGPLWGGKDNAMGLMEGTREWGIFYLGFDRGVVAHQQHSALILKRLVLNVLMEGPGTVHLRNLKLVQYPEPLAPPVVQTSPAPPGTTTMATSAARIDWKSFVLGIAATVVFLLASRGIIFVSRRWKRRRHERELRRIASLDS